MLIQLNLILFALMFTVSFIYSDVSCENLSTLSVSVAFRTIFNRSNLKCYHINIIIGSLSHFVARSSKQFMEVWRHIYAQLS